MMNITELIQWITVVSNFGFPICLSLYLLVKIDKKLENLQQFILEKDHLKGKEHS
ncbi:MAG: YvrJ family protein [Bacillus sp. (in: firmicutes)]